MDKNIFAAIGLALYEYQGNKIQKKKDETNAELQYFNVHDKEPGIITIEDKFTLWDAKARQFVKKPILSK